MNDQQIAPPTFGAGHAETAVPLWHLAISHPGGGAPLVRRTFAELAAEEIGPGVLLAAEGGFEHSTQSDNA